MLSASSLYYNLIDQIDQVDQLDYNIITSTIKSIKHIHRGSNS